MKPNINIIDLRLFKRCLSAVAFTIIKITSYFDENMGKVGVKSDTVKVYKVGTSHM